MSNQSVFINAGVPTESPKRRSDLSESIRQLVAIQTDDPSQGWRVIATYEAADHTSNGYRSAHARSQAIRMGRLAYFNKFGKWDARARFIGDGLVGLYVRWLGEDGKRWGK